MGTPYIWALALMLTPDRSDHLVVRVNPVARIRAVRSSSMVCGTCFLMATGKAVARAGAISHLETC